MNSLKYKSELALVKAQNIDITNFRERARDVQDRIRQELRPGLQALPDRDRRDRQVDRPPAEDQGRPARHRSEPSSCQRQGAGRDDQEADAGQPDDGSQVRRSKGTRSFRCWMSQFRDLTIGIEKPPRSAIRFIAVIQPDAPKRQLRPTTVPSQQSPKWALWRNSLDVRARNAPTGMGIP
jgi:hypothetical protein